VVIDELQAAFSGRQAPPTARAGQPVRPTKSAGTTGSTRAMSPTEMVDLVANVPPAEPAPGSELVAEPTKRSARRSGREAKREAQREAKRLAEHAKTQGGAARQNAKAAKAAGQASKQAAKRAGRSTGRRWRRGRQAATVPAPGPGSAVEGVRVISAEEAAATALVPATPAPSATPSPPSPPTPAAPNASPPPAPVPTVLIGVDDQPDAVYLAGDVEAEPIGEATGQRGRSTVFIEEDPSHVDVVTMDVASSAAHIEPRMRERRIAVKRAVGRRRLKWAAIVTAVALVVVGSLAVAGSGLFAIEDVRIDGRVYSGGEAFDAVVADLTGANVLRADTEASERALEAIPWVAAARVTTDFPHGAAIEVRERVPLVTFQGPDGRYRLLDRDARVLDVIAGQPTAYLELFVTDGDDLEPGQGGPRGYVAAARLVASLPPQIRAWSQSVSVDGDGTDLRLMLDSTAVGGPSGGGPNGGIEVRFGAAEELVDKIVRLQTALMNQNPDNVPTEYIDVSTADVVDR